MTDAQRNYSVQDIVRAVGGKVSSDGREVRVNAPGHSNKSPAELSIRPDPSAPGGILVNCFSGEDPVAMKDWILSRLGAPAWEPKRHEQPYLRLVQNAVAKQPKPFYDGHLTRDGYTLAAAYDYADADGVVAFQVLRYEHPTKSKTFMQRRPAPDGGWLSGRGDPLLYRLPGLLDRPDAPVFFVEGEKDADRLAALGLVATTVPNDAWPEDVSALDGRDIIVLPDNDDAGVKRASKAVDKMRSTAASIRVLDLPGLGHKGDVTDWLEAGGDVPELMALVETVQPEAVNDNGPIHATAFTLGPPADLPRREWLYGRHYIRKYVSVTVSPGGLGKTSLTTVEALAMATGRDLLGEQVHERIGVWLFNGEDPRDELERRIGAACLHYDITNDDIAGRLFVDSGREQTLTIATQTKDGIKITAPVVDAMIDNIRRNNIGVVIIDPFVSSHAVSENDNVAIDAVVKQGWAKIADACNCAVELVHHARKTGGDAVTIEHSRGAIALVAGARSGRALNPMTQEESDKAGVENRRQFFRITDEKANMAPSLDKSTWRQMVGVSLGNGRFGGDSVGVATEWRWPDAMDGVQVSDLRAVQSAIDAGEWRESSQSSNWAGIAVAEALGLDLSVPSARAKVVGMLKKWLSTGALKVERRPDEKRMMRPFIVVGERADD